MELKPNMKIAILRTLEGNSNIEKLLYVLRPVHDHGFDSSSRVTESRVFYDKKLTNM